MDTTTKIRKAPLVLTVLQPGRFDVDGPSCQVGELAVLDTGTNFTRNCNEQNTSPLFTIGYPPPTRQLAQIDVLTYSNFNHIEYEIQFKPKIKAREFP